MGTRTLKVARIGNSRGVRLPAASLRRYGIGDTVEMEELGDGILLRPSGTMVKKLSWDETAREMAASDEDWRAWNATDTDGLESIPWDSASRVAEPRTPYRRKSSSSKRR